MLKRILLSLAVVVGTWSSSGLRAQVDPNGGGFAPGGFQLDPAMMEQIQTMQQMGQQVMQNMQQSGVDPQQFFQEQMQNGGFDMQAMQQSLVDKGFMSADQMAAMNNTIGNLQQGFQNIQDQNPGAFGNMRTTMLLNNIRQQLNVTDEEWNVLLPKVQRILTVLADVRQNSNGGVSSGIMPSTAAANAAGGFGGGGGGFGGGQGGQGGFGGGQGAPGGPVAAADPNAPEAPIAKAWRELLETVQDPQSDDTRIASKLATWRGLHETARHDLDAAQNDLTHILTLRQEAVLLWMGLL